MGQILNLVNLRSFASARYSNDLPGWLLADMLHLKVPILAYRDYVTDYDAKDWPFCWRKDPQIIAALRTTVTLLKPWQATRREGGAERILRRLEPQFPRILRRVQKVLATSGKQELCSMSPNSKAATEIVRSMATAVGEIADIVKTNRKHASTNPMLGSKVLSFFLPDFFPIWDKAWISKALVTPLKEYSEEGAAADMARGLSANGARAYARYVNLMISDAWNTSAGEYKRLCAESVRLCTKVGYGGAKHLLDQFYNDSLPVVFEACLLGRAARKREF